MEKAGEPIPGSKYVRAFCTICGDPMRVSRERFQDGQYGPCESCVPPLHRDAQSIAMNGLDDGTDDEDYEALGQWDNVVRAWEDGS